MVSVTNAVFRVIGDEMMSSGGGNTDVCRLVARSDHRALCQDRDS